MVVSVLYFLVSLIFAVLGVTLAYAESRQFLLRVVPDPLDKPLGPPWILEGGPRIHLQIGVT